MPVLVGRAEHEVAVRREHAVDAGIGNDLDLTVEV